jgi:erythromycin esterase-like protein
VTVAEAIRPLAGEASDYDLVVERAAGARFALLGEASHGTHEFYKERAEITRRLITEQGFGFVAVEGDWPDGYRVNRYVRGESDDGGPEEALGDFRRFPSWMWRNTDVVDFVAWLREWNDALPLGEPRVGFYGLDLYSLYTSMEEVIRYLEEIDPEAAQRARERYSCFDHFGRDPQTYAYQAVTGGTEPCEPQVVRQLVELLSRRLEISEDETILDGDRQFYAEQNARLVVNAERYYRAAFWGGPESWNLRDRHMVETLEALVEHLEQTRQTVKGAVWAHNSHVGDARATEMGRRGELNVGQLVRGRYGDEALIGGFTTFAGTVTAASDWGAVAERKNVRPARSDSWEWLFHDTRVPRFLIETDALEGQRLERAIGVIYRPETERLSHYFQALIAKQFDLVIHFDETRAVEPLEPTSEWIEGELPETYPWAI